MRNKHISKSLTLISTLSRICTSTKKIRKLSMIIACLGLVSYVTPTQPGAVAQLAGPVPVVLQAISGNEIAGVNVDPTQPIIELRNQPGLDMCNFVTHGGHQVRTDETVQSLINDGHITRNTDGKVVLNAINMSSLVEEFLGIHVIRDLLARRPHGPDGPVLDHPDPANFVLPQNIRNELDRFRQLGDQSPIPLNARFKTWILDVNANEPAALDWMFKVWGMVEVRFQDVPFNWLNLGDSLASSLLLHQTGQEETLALLNRCLNHTIGLRTLTPATLNCFLNPLYITRLMTVYS